MVLSILILIIHILYFFIAPFSNQMPFTSFICLFSYSYLTNLDFIILVTRFRVDMIDIFFLIGNCRLKLELHFSLIAAAVAYILWRSVGQSKKSGIFQSRLHKQLSVADRSGLNGSGTLDQRRKGNWRVDCQGASKGLFLGLLSLVAGIIVLIIFFVMKVRSFSICHIFTKRKLNSQKDSINYR